MPIVGTIVCFKIQASVSNLSKRIFQESFLVSIKVLAKIRKGGDRLRDPEKKNFNGNNIQL